MRNIKRTQMESFEGKTLAEFEEKFNESMQWVARFSASYDKPVVDLATLRGYVIYEETARIPEGYRDQLELEGLRVKCEQCKHFQPGRLGWGSCKYCQGDLRKADEACDRFFKEWENGECWLIEGEKGVYGKVVNECRLESIRHGA